ncbi:MAG: hypothetical protein U1E16_04615 [Hyphomicrobiales bacterium]
MGDYFNWDRISSTGLHLRILDAAEIGRELMGTKTVRLFHEHAGEGTGRRRA